MLENKSSIMYIIYIVWQNQELIKLAMTSEDNLVEYAEKESPKIDQNFCNISENGTLEGVLLP